MRDSNLRIKASHDACLAPVKDLRDLIQLDIIKTVSNLPLRFHFSFQRISPTRIRHYIATELASYPDTDLDIVARTFMKNKPATTLKYYVHNYFQREQIRLSMKLFGSHEVHQTNPVSKESVKLWLAEMKKRIKRDFNEDYCDPQLVNAIQNVSGKWVRKIALLLLVKKEFFDAKSLSVSLIV